MNTITLPNPELEKPEYTRLSYAALQLLDDAESKFQQGIRLEDNMLQFGHANTPGHDFILSAAIEGHPLAQWWVHTRDVGEDSEGMEMLVACANRKHPIAQTFLGHFYARDNLPENQREAAELYLRAAEGGHTEAKYLIGIMCAEGIGIDQDSEQAIEWLTQAAEVEHPWAQIYLCGYYTKLGRDAEGTKWLIRAKKQKDDNVNTMIDLHYFQLSEMLAKRCDKGDEKAFETLRALASGEHANRYAVRRLYYCLKNGRGTKVNTESAYICIRRLNEQNDVFGQLVLAHMYFRGLGGLKQQYREALTCYNKAFRNPDIDTIEVPDIYLREYDSVKKHYNLNCKACRTARERCPNCVEFTPRRRLRVNKTDESQDVSEKNEKKRHRAAE